MLPPVIDWDKANRSLRTLRLNTMRGRFVTFAVLATLFTTLVMTLMLYGRNRRSLGDRTGQELRGASSDAAREMGVWLDQRLYDLRLRASPYVVSDNLARATGRNTAQSLNRLRDYLNSVRQNLPAHEGLAIIGRDGQILTSSGSRTGFRVTPDRLNNLRTRDALVGEPFWDAAINKAALVLVVPIRQDDGVFLGALGAKINLDSLKDMLDGLSADHTRSLYLITEQGRVVISSAGNSADVMKMTLPDATTRELSEREGQTVVQSRPQGREVVAVLRRIPQLRWAAVAETPRAEALRAAGVLRFRTVLLLTSLLVAVGLLAFIVGAFITRPLERLTEAAARVASGDLSVELPAGGGGEEFVVMLLEANLATATLVAERIRSRVAEQDLGEGNLSLSIGVAEYPDGGDTPEELIATADAAMYRAKSAGRNQVVVGGTSEQQQQQPPEKKSRRKRDTA